jgi:septal ring-binding cell division protein DamX
VGGAGSPAKPVKLSAAEKAAALAEKAKVAAEKAAAAVAKKEAAEAKKAAAEAKKAEKAAAPKPAPKPAAAKKAAAPAASVVVSNSAASSAEPVEAEGEFDMLDGELRFVRNGNVYEFDAMTEKVGCFLGRKTADGTIDADADEVGAAEAE